LKLNGERARIGSGKREDDGEGRKREPVVRSPEERP